MTKSSPKAATWTRKRICLQHHPAGPRLDVEHLPAGKLKRHFLSDSNNLTPYSERDQHVARKPRVGNGGRHVFFAADPNDDFDLRIGYFQRRVSLAVKPIVGRI